MQKELLLDLLDLCVEGGVKKIVFLGGDPTLYPFLPEAINRCKELSMSSEITTNGVLLSDRFFLDSLCQSGLDSVMLSLKGSNREDYLHTTGKDCFDSVLSAIQNMSECGIRFGLSAVLTTSFVEHLDSLIPQIEERGGRLLVFSFLKEPGDMYGSEAFLKENAPDRILSLLRDKLSQTIEGLEKTKWMIESCCPINNLSEETKAFFEGKFHYSCKKHIQAPLAFDTIGRLLYCNTLPDLTYGQYGINFNNYEQLRQYMRQTIG